MIFLVSILAREEDRLTSRSAQCCRSVLLSSPSLTSSDQPSKLGVYSHAGVMNGRRVYQHQEGDGWLYYYDWGSGKGANWMVGDSPGSQHRGIESPNLQARALDGQWCPEDVNIAQ